MIFVQISCLSFLARNRFGTQRATTTATFTADAQINDDTTTTILRRDDGRCHFRRQPYRQGVIADDATSLPVYSATNAPAHRLSTGPTILRAPSPRGCSRFATPRSGRLSSTVVSRCRVVPSAHAEPSRPPNSVCFQTKYLPSFSDR